MIHPPSWPRMAEPWFLWTFRTLNSMMFQPSFKFDSVYVLVAQGKFCKPWLYRPSHVTLWVKSILHGHGQPTPPSCAPLKLKDCSQWSFEFHAPNRRLERLERLEPAPFPLLELRSLPWCLVPALCFRAMPIPMRGCTRPNCGSELPSSKRVKPSQRSMKNCCCRWPLHDFCNLWTAESSNCRCLCFCGSSMINSWERWWSCQGVIVRRADSK